MAPQIQIVGSEEKKINDIGLLILAVICPPVAVGIKFGLEQEFGLNLILTILGYIPGIIHACWILNKPQSALDKIESTLNSKK